MKELQDQLEAEQYFSVSISCRVFIPLLLKPAGHEPTVLPILIGLHQAVQILPDYSRLKNAAHVTIVKSRGGSKPRCVRPARYIAVC